jgi:transcriptional regulator GlxA family with amidase domain
MKLAILLTNRHRLLSVAAALDVFETVNRFYESETGRPFFAIELVYASTQEAVAYPQQQLTSLQQGTLYEMILIPAFNQEALPESMERNGVFVRWLCQQYASGAVIGSFCTGAFLLAATGLLNNRPATTHVNAELAFIQHFPEVNLCVTDVITEKDRLYTSGGATNSFHLMIRLIAQYCSPEIALKTAKLFSIDVDRKQQAYFRLFLPPDTHSDALVKQAQVCIESRFREQQTIETLIEEVPASRRNLVRRFKQATGITPIEYLQRTRIEAAKKLLETSDRNILDVMMETGYNDLKSFRSLFRKHTGMTPAAYRQKFSLQG